MTHESKRRPVVTGGGSVVDRFAGLIAAEHTSPFSIEILGAHARN